MATEEIRVKLVVDASELDNILKKTFTTAFSGSGSSSSNSATSVINKAVTEHLTNITKTVKQTSSKFSSSSSSSSTVSSNEANWGRVPNQSGVLANTIRTLFRMRSSTSGLVSSSQNGIGDALGLGGEEGGSEGGGKEGGGILGKVGGFFKQTFSKIGGSSAGHAALVGGIAGGVAGALVSILTKIAGFVTNLAPIKAALHIASKVLTMFMLPASMVILAILLPFLQFFMNIFKTINLPQIMNQMMSVSTLIAGVLTDAFNFLKPIMPELAKTLVYIMVGVTILLLSPLLAIVAIITAFAVVIGLIELGIKDVSKFVQPLANLLAPIGTAIMGLVNFFTGKSTVSTIESGVKSLFSFIPGFASGGHIYSSGLAYVHSGETVIPANQSNTTNNNFNINLSSTGNTSMDINQLAKEIKKRIEYGTRGSTSW